MIRALLGGAIGAAAMLQLDRWWEGKKRGLSPHAITGTLLDKLNSRLGERR